MFTKNASSPDGYYSLCRCCAKARRVEYRQRPEVIERERARLAASYAANKAEVSVKRKQRYAKNKEAALAKNREWRERNLEKHRALCRAWARTNPEAMRAIVAKRRAIANGADGYYTAHDVAAMMLSQDGRCNCCQSDLAGGFHVDHRIPLSRGGSNWPSNLQLLCVSCNLSKADKLPHEFEEYRARL